MILTTVIYIEKEDKYLMLHRTKKINDISNEKWLGIGGKFEPNESPEECIIRETKEETGLTLNSINLRGIVTYIPEQNYMYVFTSNDFTGNIIECNEGDLKWISKDEIMNLNTWEGDRIFLQRLIENNHKFFSIKFYYDGDKMIKYTLNEY